MAKAPAPTTTRLMTTVNARYYPVEGVADAYCLDGRFPGKRELRAVNNTVDREGRGFLVSVFAHPSDIRRPEAWQEPLKRLAGQVGSDRGDIDTDINDLAEAALDVTGGLKLSDETAREPYFAGVIVRDGEMAAVTVGDGLAFIYRQEVLYPLTGSSKKLDPTDLYGEVVEGIQDFIAGEAGAIRYSNIAQVEKGDLIILCNGELFDVIGQKEIMRLLADSEDQLDAAGLLLTAAASQMPGTPIQVAVSKIEDLSTAEQATKFSLGRFATQAMEPVVLPEASEADSPLARTQRYERQDMVDRIRREVPPEAPAERIKPVDWSMPPLPVSEATEPFETVVPRMDDRDDYYEDLSGPAPETDFPGFAYTPAAQKRSRERAQYKEYDERDRWDTGDELDDRQGGYGVYDDYEDDYDDYDDGYRRRPRQSSDRTRRIVFYAVLITIILVCIIALVQLLSGGKNPVETDPVETTAPAPVVVPSDPDPVETTAPAETTEPTTSAPDVTDRIHVVVTGDTWWGICMRYYDRASESLCEQLAAYNEMSVNNLFVGNEIAIPPLSELLGD